jgi:quinol monooxygenase YgiN
MAFVQIIEFNSADIDSVRKLDEEWEQATEGKRTARRALVARDRNHPGRYFTIVFFDSYESAMENSRLPETQAFADRLGALTDGPATFHDLDIIDDRS